MSHHLDQVVGSLIAYFIATFVFYWWHRWRHESNFLWRGFHQIHHSPLRIEVITSFYKHPVEMVVNSVIGSLLVYTLLGLSPAAGAVYTLCTALGEFFYHTSVRTPRWAGFIISTSVTGTTTAVSCGGTCCSVRMQIRRIGHKLADSMMRKSSACSRCSPFEMCIVELKIPDSRRSPAPAWGQERALAVADGARFTSKSGQ
jgi:hypothetical protein